MSELHAQRKRGPLIGTHLQRIPASDNVITETVDVYDGSVPRLRVSSLMREQFYMQEVEIGQRGISGGQLAPVDALDIAVSFVEDIPGVGVQIATPELSRPHIIDTHSIAHPSFLE